MYSHRGDQFRLLACVWVVVASSSRLSRVVERQHEICGNCAATSSRPRRWCGNFLRQISLHVLENSDPGVFLQQRVSLDVRSSLHLLGTLENLTLRHFALNLQRQVSLHFVVWDSNLAWCTRTRRWWRACRNVRDQVQRRFDFGTTLSSPVPCCILSDISSGQQIELKMMILNRRRRLFHSSRVKLPFVNMSASCFLVSTCLIWIWGSKLMLPNNLPNATLWVRDTCLYVGLLPLMIILITASPSSKM